MDLIENQKTKLQKQTKQTFVIQEATLHNSAAIHDPFNEIAISECSNTAMLLQTLQQTTRPASDCNY
jgi:hypothetical protein